ncbi:MAG: indolepyruvate ferredoxin oxidoreductase [Rhodospirillaceae bacterium]|nr:indolepyruvate ferredoxin oxidoreductase [Rhodospirillaceae bacterium]
MNNNVTKAYHPREVSGLDDRYKLESDSIYLNGVQALVRLLLMQAQRDREAGLRTAGFVSGYRGSPLGGLDRELWRARSFLDPVPIHFQPAVNEEIAATSIWGSQQLKLFPGARYDGVFGLWYGKTPGVDRSGDAFKHANYAGTSPNGGVLAIAGDDHGCKSSTLPGQSEYGFIDASIPLLNPTNVQDILKLGLLGYALSRYSGCWIALKMTAENADSLQTVLIPSMAELIQPEFVMPQEGVHIRWPDSPNEQEERLLHYKIFAALAFSRCNSIDQVTIDSPNSQFGIVSTGKAYLDVVEALAQLGIDQERARLLGITLYKVGMSWPLEPEGIQRFCENVDEVLVIEEKRPVIESQLKEQLYNWRAKSRPKVVGKFDEVGKMLLPSAGELTLLEIAQVIAKRLSILNIAPDVQDRLRAIEEHHNLILSGQSSEKRLPHFCSGCPHNTSTRVPEGSRAIAGIGCHFMATWMDRNTSGFTQMGCEGASWLGQAPFTDTEHVFQNLGDGTYAHSGLLAIRAAVASGVNITYKILHNDAVAMTGGQPAEGGFSAMQIAQQLIAEGVSRAAVVTNQTDQYQKQSDYPHGVTVHHRKDLNSLQRKFREISGVSALIYDQTCAVELRRRRRRGTVDDPKRWVTINPLVCEGCGDCNSVSNCLSVVQLETEFGRKRTINQSACNKDFSCLDGFCPSFVSLEGIKKRKAKQSSINKSEMPALPDPEVTEGAPYNILIAGIGGTGVSTAGAIIGMAAHIEGRHVKALDQTGLAQKFGAVHSHIRVGNNQEEVHGGRIPLGATDLLIASDLIVATGDDALEKLSKNRTNAVVNSHEEMPASFISNRDIEYGKDTMLSILDSTCLKGKLSACDASGITAALLGDSITANLFLLGVASQNGLLPVSASAIEKALEINGVAIESNSAAFMWGRYAAIEPEIISKHTEPFNTKEPIAGDLREIISIREKFLVEYQNSKYAERYREGVERVKKVEEGVQSGATMLASAVARNYFKLLAYKDEYEVARLYTKTPFLKDACAEFEGKPKLKFYLSPPIFSQFDHETGRPRKYEFGAWVLPVFKLLATLKFFRGTFLDPFKYSAERRANEQLVSDYEDLIWRFVNELTPKRMQLAIQLANLPQSIRGYGPIRSASIHSVEILRDELLGLWDKPDSYDSSRGNRA